MSLGEAVREELRPRSVVPLVVLGGALVAFTDVSPAYVAWIGSLAVSASIASAAVETEVVDRRLAELALGLLLALAGVAWGWGRLRVGAPLLVPAAGTLVGLWVALDGLANYRADLRRTEPREPDWDPGPIEGARLMYEGGRAFRALDTDRLRTVEAVAAETDVDPDRVAEFLELCETEGMATRRDGGYVANPEYVGKRRSTATNARSVARRLWRPLAILTGQWTGG